MRRKIDNTMNMHWKEAAQISLAMCSSYYDVSGFRQDLNDDEQRMEI